MRVANPQGKPCALSGDLAILLFVKAPRAGACKTRLAAGMGAQRAAHLYASMAEHAIAHAAASAPGHVTLVCTPDTRHPFFTRMARRYGVRRQAQCRGDLGRRMRRAIDHGLRDHGRVVVMGSDQPALDAAPLAHADAHLSAEHPVWLAPTRDGGYWAIGLARSLPLFRGPRWSTPGVAQHTRAILRRLGINWYEFPQRHDIDHARDWHRLDAGLRQRLAVGATCPALRAASHA